MKILVTGAAGFIGYSVSKALSSLGHNVVGSDNINCYYDTKLKMARLDTLKMWALSTSGTFKFYKVDLVDDNRVSVIFEWERFDYVIHLAAQAGVRYSISNPKPYVNSNIVGYLTILEACRQTNVKHLIYASSSSVYGLNAKLPFSIKDSVDYPVSLYAATKKSNELMAHSYSHLYGLPTTGLRLFTVYGPWGRPDMALFKFTESILNGNPINTYNNGDMWRDFTYIDDVVEVIIRILERPPVSKYNHLPNQKIDIRVRYLIEYLMLETVNLFT